VVGGGWTKSSRTSLIQFRCSRVRTLLGAQERSSSKSSIRDFSKSLLSRHRPTGPTSESGPHRGHKASVWSVCTCCGPQRAVPLVYQDTLPVRGVVSQLTTMCSVLCVHHGDVVDHPQRFQCVHVRHEGRVSVCLSVCVCACACAPQLRGVCAARTLRVNVVSTAWCVNNVVHGPICSVLWLSTTCCGHAPTCRTYVEQRGVSQSGNAVCPNQCVRVRACTSTTRCGCVSTM